MVKGMVIWKNQGYIEWYKYLIINLLQASRGLSLSKMNARVKQRPV